MPNETPWRSTDGQQNAIALRTKFADGLFAIGEYDRIGHLLLYRAGSRPPATRLEEIVGVAVLRRAVMLFTGVRTLLEASLPDVAKAPARAYFELWLNHQCLAYGGAYPISLETPTSPEEREPRARRYYVAAERRGLRARALVLSPKTQFPPRSQKERDDLHAELLSEIARLRQEFPEEWRYFGDITDGSVIGHVGGRAEASWFAAEFPGKTVNSVARLAEAYGHSWDYDVLYDAFSALVHSRGIGNDVTIEENAVAVHHPHDPTWFKMITYFVAGWHLMLLVTAAKWHAPEMIAQLQQLRARHRSAMASMQPHSMPNLLG